MARRQPQPLRRHQIELRVVHGRHRVVHGADHRLILLWAGDRQHLGMGLADQRFLGAKAAGDDDLTILGERFADGFQALGLGAVEKAAGVDDDDIGAVIARREGIACA